jgi:hypothetical protein
MAARKNANDLQPSISNISGQTISNFVWQKTR